MRLFGAVRSGGKMNFVSCLFDFILNVERIKLKEKVHAVAAALELLRNNLYYYDDVIDEADTREDKKRLVLDLGNRCGLL